MCHLENVCQWSVNDCWWCTLGNLGGDRLQTVINGVVAALIGKSGSDMLRAPSWKWASPEVQQLLDFHHGESQRDVAVTVNTHPFEWSYTVQGSRILRGSSVHEISCYCPGGCGGNIPSISPYPGCYDLVNGCLWSSSTDSTDDATPKIVDAPLMLILKMGLGGFRFLFWLYRWPICCLWLCNLLPPRSPKIHDQQSLTLCWHSISGCGRACVYVRSECYGGYYVKNILCHTIVNILW